MYFFFSLIHSWFRSEGRGCEKDMELSYDYFVKGCQGDGPEGAGVGHAKACFNAALLDLNEFQGAYKRTRPSNPKAGVEFLKKVGGRPRPTTTRP